LIFKVPYMENKSAENYYRELSGKYLLEARRFVPKYDEIIEQLLACCK
jgi:hypothetical protein